MSTHPSRARVWIVPAVLISVAVALCAYHLTRSAQIQRTAGLPGALVGGACVLSAGVMFARSRRRDAWRTARWLGLGILGVGGVAVALGVAEVQGVTFVGPTPYDVTFIVISILFLIPAALEFRGHIAREDRREIAADVVLIGIALATLLYLLLRHARWRQFDQSGEPVDQLFRSRWRLGLGVGYRPGRRGRVHRAGNPAAVAVLVHRASARAYEIAGTTLGLEPENALVGSA